MLFSKFVFNILDYLLYINCNIDSIKGITCQKNIIYNNIGSLADIYYNGEYKNKYPVLINIHGGGFVAGDKKFRKSYNKHIASENVFVLCINYTLCPESKFPDFIIESANALQWVKDNADKYNLDIDNVFIAGDSAGAYIAAYLGNLQTNKHLRKRLNIDQLALPIKALLLYCGPYNVESLLTKKIMLNLQAEIASAFLNIKKKDINEITLENYKNRDILDVTEFINKDFPISFVTYPINDFLCPEQGEPFIKLLQEKGIKYRYHKGDKTRDVHCYHFFWHSRNGRVAMNETKKFIKDVINNNI